MEIHRQTCQKCSSRNMKNLLVREPGEPDKVFVQCQQCRELVARYIIGPAGYYHHGKGFESYIRGLGRAGYMMSGKNAKNEFESIKEKALEKYQKILAQLDSENKLGD